MNNNAKSIKRKLDQAIQKLLWNRKEYVHNPERDFTRNRKLSLGTLIELLITMGAGSQNKEILEFFKFDVKLPTASALIQQRNKLKPSGLQFVLQEFSKSVKKLRKFRGYRLLAIDGSKVLIFREPDDLETFTIYTDGVNFLHVNALYDISNKLYVDASIDPIKRSNETHGLTEITKRSPLSKKVILVADRGYEAYNNIAHLEQKGWNYVIRVKARDKGNGILSKTDLPVGVEFDETVSVLMTRQQTTK